MAERLAGSTSETSRVTPAAAARPPSAVIRRRPHPCRRALSCTATMLTCQMLGNGGGSNQVTMPRSSSSSSQSPIPLTVPVLSASASSSRTALWTSRSQGSPGAAQRNSANCGRSSARSGRRAKRPHLVVGGPLALGLAGQSLDQRQPRRRHLHRLEHARRLRHVRRRIGGSDVLGSIGSNASHTCPQTAHPGRLGGTTGRDIGGHAGETPGSPSRSQRAPPGRLRTTVPRLGVPVPFAGGARCTNLAAWSAAASSIDRLALSVT